MAELKKSNEKLDKVLQRIARTGRRKPSCSGPRCASWSAPSSITGSWRAGRWRDTGNPHPQAAQGVRGDPARAGGAQLPRQIHGNANYTIKYDKETKDGNEADVTGTLNTMSRGKKVKIALEYKMIWQGRTGWSTT